jgi:hypothetical protein
MVTVYGTLFSIIMVTLIDMVIIAAMTIVTTRPLLLVGFNQPSCFSE